MRGHDVATNHRFIDDRDAWLWCLKCGTVVTPIHHDDHPIEWTEIVDAGTRPQRDDPPATTHEG